MEIWESIHTVTMRVSSTSSFTIWITFHSRGEKGHKCCFLSCRRLIIIQAIFVPTNNSSKPFSPLFKDGHHTWKCLSGRQICLGPWLLGRLKMNMRQLQHFAQWLHRTPIAALDTNKIRCLTPVEFNNHYFGLL